MSSNANAAHYATSAFSFSFAGYALYFLLLKISQFPRNSSVNNKLGSRLTLIWLAPICESVVYRHILIVI